MTLAAPCQHHIADDDPALARIAAGLQRAERARHFGRILRWAAALTSAFALATVLAK